MSKIYIKILSVFSLIILLGTIGCLKENWPIKVKGTLTDYYTGQPITNFKFSIYEKSHGGLFGGPLTEYIDNIAVNNDGEFKIKFQNKKSTSFYLGYSLFSNSAYKVTTNLFDEPLKTGRNKCNVQAKQEQILTVKVSNLSKKYNYLRFYIEYRSNETYYDRLTADGTFLVNGVFPDHDNSIDVDLFVDSIVNNPDSTVNLRINKPYLDFSPVQIEI